MKNQMGMYCGHDLVATTLVWNHMNTFGNNRGYWYNYISRVKTSLKFCSVIGGCLNLV